MYLVYTNASPVPVHGFYINMYVCMALITQHTAIKLNKQALCSGVQTCVDFGVSIFASAPHLLVFRQSLNQWAKKQKFGL